MITVDYHLSEYLDYINSILIEINRALNSIPRLDGVIT